MGAIPVGVLRRVPWRYLGGGTGSRALFFGRDAKWGGKRRMSNGTSHTVWMTQRACLLFGALLFSGLNASIVDAAPESLQEAKSIYSHELMRIAAWHKGASDQYLDTFEASLDRGLESF